MDTCCTAPTLSTPAASEECPSCKGVGRTVDRITLKALLRPPALMRLSAPSHRFCSTPDCPIVYFGREETFGCGDLTVLVLQKEPAGTRLVCYCFGVTETDMRREILESGRSTAADQITALVKAGRCACEVKNPQGSCCLGNITALAKELGRSRADASE
jgi:hypothetical protein